MSNNRAFYPPPEYLLPKPKEEVATEEEVKFTSAQVSVILKQDKENFKTNLDLYQKLVSNGLIKKE